MHIFHVALALKIEQVLFSSSPRRRLRTIQNQVDLAPNHPVKKGENAGKRSVWETSWEDSYVSWLGILWEPFSVRNMRNTVITLRDILGYDYETL